jgi:hypothetical protein
MTRQPTTGPPSIRPAEGTPGLGHRSSDSCRYPPALTGRIEITDFSLAKLFEFAHIDRTDQEPDRLALTGDGETNLLQGSTRFIREASKCDHIAGLATKVWWCLDQAGLMENSDSAPEIRYDADRRPDMDVFSRRYEPRTIEAKTKNISGRLLAGSPHMRQLNFEAIADRDVATLFRLYDEVFFDGSLERRITEKSKEPMTFRVSSRMTRAGGKTIMRERRYRNGKRTVIYEIAVASRLLFLTFSDVDRPVTIGGMPCENRLQALQRIIEHEIIHSIELLEWGRSSCNQSRFKHLVGDIFGHTHVRHDLVLPEEDAAKRLGIRLGAMAAFDIEGERLIGRVNRVNRRATMLVEDANGDRYSDGNRYQKYYVPLRHLRAVERSAAVR